MKYRKKEGKIGHRLITEDDIDTMIALCETSGSGYMEIADKLLSNALKSCNLAVPVEGMPDAIRCTYKLQDVVKDWLKKNHEK